MKFTYDSRYNIAYIRFRPKSGDVESIKISEEMVVDMAPDGTVYGVADTVCRRTLGAGAAYDNTALFLD